MSTATEISRLTDARNTIRDKLIALGLATSTDKLDALAEAIDSIANRGAVTATVQEGDTYTIPAGYHNGSGTVSGVAGGGNYNLQSKTATPTKSQQSITPDSGYYGLSDVTVAAIPQAYQNVSAVTAVATDVLAGKVIVDATGTSITGTMPNNGAVSKTLDASSNNQSYTVPAGYHNGSGKVQITLETKSVTPTTSSQTVSPTTGKVLSSVTVGAIPSNYKDASNADAVPANVLSGIVFVTANGEATGTMPNNSDTTVTLDVSSENAKTYTIPAGYHSGNSEVKIVSETKTITPTTSTQNISATSGKVISGVTVNPIPDKFGDTSGDDVVAANILDGKIAHGYNSTTGKAVEITGTMPNNGAVTYTLDATTGKQSYTIPAGYHNGSGSVNITLETKTATPSASTQNIAPTSGKVLEKVTVNAIPSNWGNTTGDTATAANLLAGAIAHTIVSGTATQITGTMPNNGAISATIDGLTTTSYSVPSGYTTGGTVSLTSDIEDALAAI